MARHGGGRPTIERSITLDVRHLTRAGLAPGCQLSGQLQWTWPSTGQPVCQIEYRATLSNGNTGSLHLISVTRFDQLGRPVRTEGQTIQMVVTIPPYGGRRWWFLCPSTGQRAMKLHLPYDAWFFASRQAYRLGYAVQRESAPAQARRRARKARARIGGDPDLTQRLPWKPKWVRWATYWRHVDACHRADEEVLEFLIADTRKTRGRRSAA
jgi:hypothetical protein